MASVTFNRNGAVKTVPKGYSFTTLLFGFIPSALRGHWSFMIKCIIADIGSMVISAWMFHGADALGILILVRIGAGYVRNSELYEYLRADGWFAPEIKSELKVDLNQPAANDIRSGHERN